MKHRTLTPKQKAAARRSARRHGRSKPGLWENVNASKGRGSRAKKGKTRPGRRSKTRKTGSQKRRAARKR